MVWGESLHLWAEIHQHQLLESHTQDQDTASFKPQQLGPLSWKTPTQMQMLPRVWLQSTKNAGQEKGGCYFSHLSCNSRSPKPVSVAAWNAPIPQIRYICSLRTWFLLMQWKNPIVKEATRTTEQKDSASQNTSLP